MDKYRVTLTLEEGAELKRLISAGKAAARKLGPARILVLADVVQGDGCSDEEIVSALGTSLRTVARVGSDSSRRDCQQPSTPGPNRPDRTRARLRETSNRR